MKKFENFTSDGEFSEFPYVKKFKCAIVYSKEEFMEHEFGDESEEIEDDELGKFDIYKDTRIGILSVYEDDLETVIVFTDDSFFYGYEDNMTTDSVNYFEMEPDVHYVPAQEPVDLMDTGYENGGGMPLEHKDELKKLAQKYNLDHFLISV